MDDSMPISEKEFLRRRDKVVRGLVKLFESMGLDTEELEQLRKCGRVSEFKEKLTGILNDVDARGLIKDRKSFAKKMDKVLGKLMLRVVFINDRWVVFYKGHGARRRAGIKLRTVVGVVTGGVVGFFYLGVLALFMEVYDTPGVMRYIVWIAFAYNTYRTLGYFIGLKRWSGGEYGVRAYIVNTAYIIALNMALIMVFHFMAKKDLYYLMYFLLYLGVALLPYARRQEEYPPPPIIIPIPV